MLSRQAVNDQNASTSVTKTTNETSIKQKSVPTELMGRNNFLLLGAKKAKALRSARSAARVGCVVVDDLTHRNNKAASTERLCHTGSGMPLSQVVKLKYVKGFTQAVSMPCRLDDLS
jgi:hypothetical protein